MHRCLRRSARLSRPSSRYPPSMVETIVTTKIGDWSMSLSRTSHDTIIQRQQTVLITRIEGGSTACSSRDCRSRLLKPSSTAHSDDARSSDGIQPALIRRIQSWRSTRPCFGSKWRRMLMDRPAAKSLATTIPAARTLRYGQEVSASLTTPNLSTSLSKS